LKWLGVPEGTFYKWRERYGKANEHNGKIPRDHWLEAWERRAIVDFHFAHSLEGYRALTYMMLDADVVAVSPSTVYRVLKSEGLVGRWNRKPRTKGKGFDQPDGPHRHWHCDIAYVNIRGTFYHLISVLDGFSRYIVHWEIRESMTERDVEIVLERAKEKFPGQKPRIITDNGSQFIAKDFKTFIRISGMTHVRTSPYYPQSNGKLERFHRTIKSDCIRPGTPLSLSDARRIVGEFVTHYNESRLHSAIGYVTPLDKLAGRAAAIHAARNTKLEAAREARRLRRQEHRQACYTDDTYEEDRALLASNPSASLGPEASAGGELLSPSAPSNLLLA
jgi:transposase InsO family protein